MSLCGGGDSSHVEVPGAVQTCANVPTFSHQRGRLTHSYDIPPCHPLFVVLGLGAEVDAVCVAPDRVSAAAERFVSRPDISGRGDVDEIYCRLKREPQRRNRRGGKQRERGRDLELEKRSNGPRRCKGWGPGAP